MHPKEKAVIENEWWEGGGCDILKRSATWMEKQGISQKNRNAI